MSKKKNKRKRKTETIELIRCTSTSRVPQQMRRFHLILISFLSPHTSYERTWEGRKEGRKRLALGVDPEAVEKLVDSTRTSEASCDNRQSSSNSRMKLVRLPRTESHFLELCAPLICFSLQRRTFVGCCRCLFQRYTSLAARTSIV